MDYKAIGLIELNSVATGVQCADDMLKASEVELLMARSACPGRYLIMIAGDTGSVQNSVDVGTDTAGEFIVGTFVIPNVHPTVFPALSCATDVGEMGSLGIIETYSTASCIIAADAAVKAGDVNLIEIRFPSLIEHVAPFVCPVEAARQEARSQKTVFVAICPAQYTVLSARDWSPSADVIGPNGLRKALMPLLAGKRGPSRAPKEARRPSPVDTTDTLEVCGIGHVVNVLEALENGRLDDVGVLELWACDQGCFGSPLLAEDPFVARRRWQQAAWGNDEPGRAVPRDRPLVARSGLRLDADMGRAVRRLAEIDRLRRTLPGRDCARCGAPTCDALAEDVVLGRSSRSACVHVDAKGGDTT